MAALSHSFCCMSPCKPSGHPAVHVSGSMHLRPKHTDHVVDHHPNCHSHHWSQLVETSNPKTQGFLQFLPPKCHLDEAFDAVIPMQTASLDDQTQWHSHPIFRRSVRTALTMGSRAQNPHPLHEGGSIHFDAGFFLPSKHLLGHTSTADWHKARRPKSSLTAEAEKTRWRMARERRGA